MDMSSSQMALHELSMSMKQYKQEDYDEAIEHFLEFSEEVNKSWNDLFSERKGKLVESYANRLENSDQKENELEDTFEEFVRNLISDLHDVETLTATINRVEDRSEINTSSIAIISESFGALGIDRYVLYSLIISTAGVVLFYSVDEQLGMLSLAALSPIISIFSNRNSR